MTESNHYAKRCAFCMAEHPLPGACSICHGDDAAVPDAHNQMPRHYVLLGRYYIGRVLGQGGFGITYLAFDLKLQRRMAIKEYFPSSLCSRLTNRVTIQSSGGVRDHYLYGLSRFLEEARVLARFDHHPCIVPISEFLEANGTAYLVMAFLDGMTLKAYLAQQPDGKMPWAVALETLMPVMEALKEVHMHGLLHRDISPDNIFITGSRQVKLLDFGAARQAVGEMSQSLSVILKPGFAPEEQYRSNGRQGPWTDVYALSATLYRCVTGKTPPPSVDRLAEDAMASPSSLCPELSREQDSVLLKGLAVKAQDRYQTVAEFQAGVAMLPPPPPPPDRLQPGPAQTMNGEGPSMLQHKRSIPVSWLMGLGALALVLIVVLIVVLSESHERENQQTVNTLFPPAADRDPLKLDPTPPATDPQQGQAPGQQQVDDRPKPEPPPTVTLKLAPEEEDWKSVDAAFDEQAAKMTNEVATIYLKNVCMQTPIRVALRFISPANGSWVTLGWRNVPSGRILNTHFITKNQMVYAYAEGGGKIWNGDKDSDSMETQVVSDSLFSHKEGTLIEGEGKRTVSMFSSKITRVGDYTISFSCQ